MNKKDILQTVLAKLDSVKEEKVELPVMGSWPQTFHLFDERSIWAVKAALAAERPLLVRGEPGTGKSQLARAVAYVVGRAFISEVVHARSECRDLQWHYDAVSRLGEAQALGASRSDVDVTKHLNPLRFLSPGALWWAFDWHSACNQFEQCHDHICMPITPKDWNPTFGCVVLIDEIDKADADLPNGLLETLGNGAFTVPFLKEAVGLSKDTPAPLVVITTNEERELPTAFIRRCLVLHLELPKEELKLKAWLMKRGEIHFGPGCPEECSEAVRKEAANQLWQDREDALKRSVPAPGQAEYLDMLRAVCRISNDETKQMEALEKIRDFALVKNAVEFRP
ncbi:MAG: AAA family ATPase [Candidatus Omnitrophota bacterium]